jgi:hypothetical protein
MKRQPGKRIPAAETAHLWIPGWNMGHRNQRNKLTVDELTSLKEVSVTSGRLGYGHWSRLVCVLRRGGVQCRIGHLIRKVE